tara:strand:+ start:800 stop:1294 length:495 start_codon:yes stop_codon:yes gene_type:complete
METFKDIPTWEGIYQVSDIGNVKSLPRRYSPGENILRPTVSRDGYLKVCLKANERKESFEVNRLMALAFISDSYTERDLVCDHIDRDRKNNKLSNLRLVSHRKNSTNTVRANRLTGAYRQGNKWQASIGTMNKSKYIGLYATEMEAHQAYLKALELLEREELNK